MARLKNYYEKKQLMNQLAEELEKLEEDQALKKDLEFEERVRELLKEYEKSPQDALMVLTVIDPGLAPNKTSEVDNYFSPRRAIKVYTNPHTGEVVETRGANHNRLKEWRKEYGTEAVRSWSKVKE